MVARKQEHVDAAQKRAAVANAPQRELSVDDQKRLVALLAERQDYVTREDKRDRVAAIDAEIARVKGA